MPRPPYSFHERSVVSADLEKSESKKAAIAILNMFDVDVIHLIEGDDINRPYNAITLTKEMHESFGRFDVFFERISDASHPPTYRINTFFPVSAKDLPVARTLLEHPSIDPPSEQQHTHHTTDTHKLHLSGAAACIECILDDMDLGVVREDGSTQLGLLVHAALQI